MDEVDVTVVGGGQGGIYDAYRFSSEGMSVIGLDGASDFGGVWYHNRYPGARVDSDSVDYCFQFSKELYSEWRWPERYADAETLHRYLNFVADKLDVRRLFRFKTWLRKAQWSENDKHWHLETDQGDRIKSRFLVMATGVLSEPKSLSFPGLERFRGEWFRASRWPPDAMSSLRGRKVGIIGTGSSGAQAIPILAREAEHLYVFQRHPHWGIPAQNRPTDPGLQDAIARDLESERQRALGYGGPADPETGAVRNKREPARPVDSFNRREQEELLERQWEFGGHGMSYLFADETTNPAANDVVSDFIRGKIRERVTDPALAEKLSPRYPIGTKRLILEIDYYEAYNQDNVSLVDISADPIVEITERGVRTVDAHYDVDILVFALGFQSFLGPLEAAGIRNENGQTTKDLWSSGPKTLFGLMTPTLPNLFHPTNAGSPSVLGNAMLQHEFFGDWMADCFRHLAKSNYSTIEASDSAANDWMNTVDSYAKKILPIRRGEDQYMVHINSDGSRLFMPFCAGMGEYVPKIQEATARGYEGFVLR